VLRRPATAEKQGSGKRYRQGEPDEVSHVLMKSFIPALLRYGSKDFT